MAIHYGIKADSDFIVQNLYSQGKHERRYIISKQDLDKEYAIKVYKQSNFQLENIILADKLKIKHVGAELKHEINYLTLISNNETYVIHKQDYKLVKDKHPEIAEAYNELEHSIVSSVENESQAVIDVWDI